MLTLFEEATSSITLENVIKTHKFASTHTHSLKSVVEKTITVGKLEGSVDVISILILWCYIVEFVLSLCLQHGEFYIVKLF